MFAKQEVEETEGIANYRIRHAEQRIERLSKDCENKRYCRPLAIPKERYDELMRNSEDLLAKLKDLVQTASPLCADVTSLLVNKNYFNFQAVVRIVTKHFRNMPEIVDAVFAAGKSLYTVLCTLKQIVVPLVFNLVETVKNWLNLFLRSIFPKAMPVENDRYICYGVRDVRLQITLTADDFMNRAKLAEEKGQSDIAVIYVVAAVKMKELDVDVNIPECGCFSECNTIAN